MSKSKFVHLHTHSHYSLLDGLSQIEPLVDRTKELGMDALAITDHGNMYGSVEFYKKAKKEGIKPIIGLETYVAKGSRHSKDPKIDNVRYHLTLLVKNQTGYKNLTQLLTKSHLEGFYYKPRIDRELIEKYREGIICLSGCFSGELGRFLREGKEKEAEETAKYYKSVFGDDYYIEIQPHNPEIQPKLVEISKKLNVPLVATQDSHYLKKDDKHIHEVLLAIQTNNRLDDEDRFTFKEHDSSFRSPEEMAELFSDFPEAIENTVKIADKCDFEFTLGKPIVPKYPLPKGENADEYLQKLVNEKVKTRFKKETKEVRERIDYELGVIKQMGFADYFLIVQDFVNWAKKHKIAVGPGRGSAAGSIVSYVIGITDVDPLKYDLLFERFLNPGRNEMPDIDMDFADNRRDEVLGYLKEKYGEDHVAQIITFGTMAARAAIRDAGRALGLPYSLCDMVAKLIPFMLQGSAAATLKDFIERIPELKQLYYGDSKVKELIDVASRLEGVARHASVHACGTVITEKPIVEYLPLQRAPQDENTIITEIEMHGIESLGLLKVDLLGLRNLTIIENTLRLIKEMEGKDVDISKIPLDDQNVFELLRKTETAGVFQFESSGMRRYMKDIKPTELEDLVALVALYRPGPMELIPSYIRRKHGDEEVTYIHPSLEPILEKTYGIGIYQEQMMRIATDLAGYSLPEADTLRKAIGKKIKKLLDEQEEKMMNGMISNGIDKKTAEKIWDLFPPFARYGFPRAHAVCYALIGYQTAYLKTYYPVEFITAILNNAATDIDRVGFFVSESQRMGIEILPPDVNKSMSEFVPENGNIRFGMSTIKNVGEKITESIVNERLKNGPYEGLVGFVKRTKEYGLNKKTLESLIKSGSLDSMGVERATALENMENILKAAKDKKSESQQDLFGGNHSFEIKIKPAEKPATKEQMLAWEKELIGLYVTEHPLKNYMKKNSGRGIQEIKEALKEKESKSVKICGVISKIQRIQTKNGQPMLFVKVEDLSDNIEILVFSDMIGKDESVWKENSSVLINGKVSKRNGDTKLICQKIQAIEV